MYLRVLSYCFAELISLLKMIKSIQRNIHIIKTLIFLYFERGITRTTRIGNNKA